jgi:hypothetical protein
LKQIRGLVHLGMGGAFSPNPTCSVGADITSVVDHPLELDEAHRFRIFLPAAQFPKLSVSSICGGFTPQVAGSDANLRFIED